VHTAVRVTPAPQFDRAKGIFVKLDSQQNIPKRQMRCEERRSDKWSAVCHSIVVSKRCWSLAITSTPRLPQRTFAEARQTGMKAVRPWFGADSVVMRLNNAKRDEQDRTKVWQIFRVDALSPVWHVALAMDESENQFPLTHAALITAGREKGNFHLSVHPAGCVGEGRVFLSDLGSTT
jgi:hypothetical protein